MKSFHKIVQISWKVQNRFTKNHYLKKDLNSKQKITDRYPPSPLFLKFLKKLSRTKHKHTWTETTYFKFQSGFRQNYTTDTAISYLTNKNQCGFDEGLFTGMILIHLQKPFDTIDHNIFVNKLNYLDFCESTIAWYKSYLEEWYFRVCWRIFITTSKISLWFPSWFNSRPPNFLNLCK